MKNVVLLLALFLSSTSFCLAQNSVSKYVYDYVNKKPIIYATINNTKNHNITNEDGFFTFISVNDSIIIRSLGYISLKTTFEEIHKKDTVFLERESYLLNEVVIKDYRGMLYKSYNNIEKNYPNYEYVDDFFIRTILKKNDSIIKIEDINGRIKRNSMFHSQSISNLNFEFEILNQRKLGLINKKKKTVEVQLHTLDDLFQTFARIFTNINDFEFTEENSYSNLYSKIKFIPLEKKSYNVSGYYILNDIDNSIKEYYIKTEAANTNQIPVKKLLLGFKWGISETQLHLSYHKNESISKYHISQANFKGNYVVYDRKNKKDVYSVEYQLIVTEPFSDITSFKANTKSSKELFKINCKYDESFWTIQNQLPLTNEISKFINNIKIFEDKYKIISNF